MALTTDDQALTTAAESPGAPASEAPRPHPRRVAALAWGGAGLGLAAVAALSIVALRDDDRPAKTDDNARTVIEHGSIAAIDHRVEVAQAQRTPSETVAEHGSVAAADHRADVDATTARTMAEHASEQDPALREQMVLAHQDSADPGRPWYARPR